MFWSPVQQSTQYSLKARLVQANEMADCWLLKIGGSTRRFELRGASQ